MSTKIGKVKSIRKISRIEKNTYNIGIKKNHNYFANGILCHNCIDDAHNSVEVESDLVRQGVLDWYDGSFSTRHNSPKTDVFTIVMQRLHQDDLSGHILEKGDGNFTHLMLPMRHDIDRHCTTAVGFTDPRIEDKELLWPERLGEKEVKALETALGIYGTSGQLQQCPAPKGGGVIKESYWKEWTDPFFPPLEYVIASCDTAYTEKEVNDYSACVVMGVYRDAYDLPKIMVMHAWQKRLGLNALVNEIAKTAKKYKVDRVLIENKASGISVAQEIRRLFQDSIFGISMSDAKGDKMSRLVSIEPLFAEGIVFIPFLKDPVTGYLTARDWAEMLMNQVTLFPRAKHDDLTDALSHGIRHLRQNGLIVRREERDADLAQRMLFTGAKQPLYDC